MTCNFTSKLKYFLSFPSAYKIKIKVKVLCVLVKLLYYTIHIVLSLLLTISPTMGIWIFIFSSIWQFSSSLTSSKMAAQTFQESLVFPAAFIAPNTLWEHCYHFTWLHSILYCSLRASQSKNAIFSKISLNLGFLKKWLFPSLGKKFQDDSEIC